MARPHGKNAFMFVIVTVLIDMIGFGLIIPVLPTLISELTGLSMADAVEWAGPLAAVYALMNFMFGPLLGNLSDRFGRRPVLLFSMGMLGVDFLIMGFAHSIWMLFLGRILSGISGATFSTASAYIADVTEPDKRGQAFGMIGAAFGVGFIIGPVVGGLLGQIDPRAPFFAAAAMSCLNLIYGLFVLPESLAPENRREINLKRANPLGAFAHFSKLPHVGWILLATGLYSLAHFVYPATWAFHGEIRYGWSPGQIGMSLGLVGLASAIVQGGLIRIFLKKLGPVRTALVGLGFGAVAMVGFAFAGQGWIALWLISISGLGGLVGPAFNAIVSGRTPANAQGELQGATASIQSMAAIISPIVMTQTLHKFSSEGAPIHFPGAAFLLGAILTVIAVIPFLLGVNSTTPAAPANEQDAPADTADTATASAR